MVLYSKLSNINILSYLRPSVIIIVNKSGTEYSVINILSS